MTSYIKPAFTGTTSFGIMNEDNDCVVRAVANVTEMSYEEAHRIASDAGRIVGNGVYLKQSKKILNAINAECVGIFGTTSTSTEMRTVFPDAPSYLGTTVKRALNHLQDGKFIVYVYRHAFAVIDGQIIDSAPVKSSTRVCAIFKLPE